MSQRANYYNDKKLGPIANMWSFIESSDKLQPCRVQHYEKLSEFTCFGDCRLSNICEWKFICSVDVVKIVSDNGTKRGKNGNVFWD